jgi:hypothetical protein
MTTPFIVPAYGAIFALFFIVLAFRVSAVRRSAGVSLGTGGDPRLERAVRTHGNFAEFVPFGLLLLGFLEMQRTSAFTLHALCLALLAGRILHAIGIGQETVPPRAIGMVLTYLVLIVTAIMLLYDYVRVATL